MPLAAPARSQIGSVRQNPFIQSPLLTYLRCRFRSRGATVLRFVDGSSLEVPRPRDLRNVLRLLWSGELKDVRAEDGLLHFRYRNHQLALRPTACDDFIFQEVVVDGAYRPALDRAEGSLGTVVDLGANIGLFAQEVGCRAERLLLIEPDPDNGAVLGRNVTLAGLDDRATVLPCAVAGETGEVSFYRSVKSVCHSASKQFVESYGAVLEELRVPALSLARLFDEHHVERCGLLKCDIEGGEYDVFEAAAPDVLARIDSIVMEAHIAPPDYPQERFTRLVSQLRAAGFTVVHTQLCSDRERFNVMLQARRAHTTRVS